MKGRPVHHMAAISICFIYALCNAFSEKRMLKLF